MRNILGACSLRYRKEVAEQVKLILQAPDKEEAQRRFNQFAEAYETKVPKAVACLEETFEDAIAVMSLPDKYRKRFRTTNMQERLNQEVIPTLIFKHDFVNCLLSIIYTLRVSSLVLFNLRFGIRRRERVIRIFPNDHSAQRLIGALLAEMNEQWQTRRYLDMDEFNEWWEEQQNTQSNILELNKKVN